MTTVRNLLLLIMLMLMKHAYGDYKGEGVRWFYYSNKKFLP